MTELHSSASPLGLADPWKPRIPSGPLAATVRVPGSKSLTARYLTLAAIADGPSTIVSPLRARDTDLLAAALTACGVDIAHTLVEDAPAWQVRGPLCAPSEPLDVGLAGTAMRFLPAVLAHQPGTSVLVGDDRAAQRPLVPLLDALRSLGVRCDTPDGASLPLTLHGRPDLPGGQVEVDASTSSQFLSALLLAGPLFRDGLVVSHRSPTGAPPPSAPHIEMTCAVAREFGAVIEQQGPHTWAVRPGALRGGTFAVEPDLTNAATFVAAAAVHGGTIRLPQWPQKTTQAGDAIVDIVENMGVSCTRGEDGLTVTSPGRLTAVDLDLSAHGELVPVVAALAACATGTSTLRGVAHVRGHESNRLHALATELNACGATVAELPDGLRIIPGPPRAHQFATYADHRLVMAGAVMALRCPEVRVADPAAAAKTFPTFPQVWDAMAGDIT